MITYCVGTSQFSDLFAALDRMRATGEPVYRDGVMLAYMGKARHRDMRERRPFVLGQRKRVAA
jgi:hypothetical protein